MSSREHFGTCTVRRCGCFGRWTFQQGNLSTWGNIGTVNFRHDEFSAQEHFGTWIFWHPAKQYGRLSTDILAPVLLCQNVHVPKCPRTKAPIVAKNPWAEKSLCRKVLVPKHPCAGTPTGPKSACNKYPGDEMSVPKYLWPKGLLL